MFRVCDLDWKGCFSVYENMMLPKIFSKAGSLNEKLMNSPGLGQVKYLYLSTCTCTWTCQYLYLLVLIVLKFGKYLYLLVLGVLSTWCTWFKYIKYSIHGVVFSNMNNIFFFHIRNCYLNKAYIEKLYWNSL